MSWASSIGNCEVIMPKIPESDKNKNKARIYLAKSALGASGKNSREPEAEGLLTHWAIVVNFYELDVWVEMGGVQSECKLQGCYIKSKDKPIGTLYKLNNVTRLGFPTWLPNIFEIITSPYVLYQIVKTHPYNNKTYDVFSMQCIEWAIKAAVIIAEQVEKVNTTKDNCKLM